MRASWSLALLIAGAIPALAKFSLDGTCGGSDGVTCTGSIFGQCCGSNNQCGSGPNYCGDGCQAKFGFCTSTKGKVSVDGTCGGASGFTCQGSEFGDCCSPYGFCGKSSDYCGKGCKTAFGTCSSSSKRSTLAPRTLSCPAADGSIITTDSGKSFQVECSTDHSGGDLPNMPIYLPSLDACIAKCDNTTMCVDVTWIKGSPSGPCYMKSNVGSKSTNNNAMGAIRVYPVTTTVTTDYTTVATVSNSVTSSVSGAPVVSSNATTTTSASLTTITGATTVVTTTYAQASSTALACPGMNNTVFTTECGATFLIECGRDHSGGDLPGGGFYVDSLMTCAQNCSSNPQCVDVSWVRGTPKGACYWKKSVGANVNSANVWGAKLLTNCTINTSTLSSTMSSTSASLSSSSTSASASITNSANSTTTSTIRSTSSSGSVSGSITPSANSTLSSSVSSTSSSVSGSITPSANITSTLSSTSSSVSGSVSNSANGTTSSSISSSSSSGSVFLNSTTSSSISSTSSSVSGSITNSANATTSSILSSSSSTSGFLNSTTSSAISSSATASTGFSISINSTSSSIVSATITNSANGTSTTLSATITPAPNTTSSIGTSVGTISNSINSTTTTNSSTVCSSKPTATAACVPCEGQGGSLPYCGADASTNYYNFVPKTCNVVKYTFEISNVTSFSDADGVPRQALVINGQMPGPLLEANWGDTVVVTVKNMMQTNGTSIHFHGIRQNFTNQNDGVPSITQCPIAPGEEMTYTWVATNYGTSWYHSHYAIQAWEGVIGPMIIHGPSSAAYDVDAGMMQLQDWTHVGVDAMYDSAQDATLPFGNPGGGPRIMDNGLINGKNTWGADGTANQTGSRYIVPTNFVSGQTYLFRLVNSAIQSTYKFYIDQHTLTVISMDFVPIVPYKTTILNINIGQRYNVLVKADQPAGSYWARADNQNTCATTTQAKDIKAIINYSGFSGTPTSTAYNYTDECIDEPLASLVPFVPLSPSSADSTVEKSVTLGVNNAALYKWYLTGTAAANSFLSYYDDPTLYGVYENDTAPTTSGDLLINAPNAGQWIYIIIESGVPLPHPIHLHGHDFFVLAAGSGSYDSSVTLNMNNPPRRDTSLMPTAGFLVVAFETDNPGAWLMHCHIGWHTSMGFAMQILEMQDKIKATIDDSCTLEDTCTNWKSWASTNVFSQLDSGV